MASSWGRVGVYQTQRGGGDSFDTGRVSAAGCWGILRVRGGLGPVVSRVQWIFLVVAVVARPRERERKRQRGALMWLVWVSAAYSHMLHRRSPFNVINDRIHMIPQQYLMLFIQNLSIKFSLHSR